MNDCKLQKEPASADSKLKALQQQVQTLSKALTEQIYLRDVLLLVNTANNPYDRAIVEKLMSGTKLEDGEWQHIFDEISKIPLPDAHTEAMQTIFLRLKRSRNANTEGA